MLSEALWYLLIVLMACFCLQFMAKHKHIRGLVLQRRLMKSLLSKDRGRHRELSCNDLCVPKRQWSKLSLCSCRTAGIARFSKNKIINIMNWALLLLVPKQAGPHESLPVNSFNLDSSEKAMAGKCWASVSFQQNGYWIQQTCKLNS